MEKKEEETQEEREPVSVTITDVELETLKKEASEFKNKYLHLLADAENARKRLQKERQELIQYALENLIIDFLHPIDHMENALKFIDQASDEVKHWAVGFKMILNQFKDVLMSNGVTPIEAGGAKFDPHVHEAVEMVVTEEHPPGVVVEETIRGYRMGDKTIRPARVKVSKEPSEESEKVNDVKES